MCCSHERTLGIGIPDFLAAHREPFPDGRARAGRRAVALGGPQPAPRRRRDGRTSQIGLPTARCRNGRSRTGVDDGRPHRRPVRGRIVIVKNNQKSSFLGVHGDTSVSRLRRLRPSGLLAGVRPVRGSSALQRHGPLLQYPRGWSEAAPVQMRRLNRPGSNPGRIWVVRAGYQVGVYARYCRPRLSHRGQGVAFRAWGRGRAQPDAGRQ